MLSARLPDLTSMCTRITVGARKTAGLPAEFPPPATTTSSPPHNCAFKLCQIFQRQPAILCTRSNDGRTRGNTGTAIHFNGVRLAVASEPHGTPRDDHLSAKLLRLRVCATGELLARNTGREAQVVLNLRARSC